MRTIADLTPEEQRSLCQFNFVGGPVDNFDGAEIAFLAFGHAAMTWARLETHVNALLIQVNKRRFSPELFDPDHPVSFSRKLKLLKSWFDSHKALAKFRTKMNSLIKKLRELSGFRNDFLHALFDNYDADTKLITLKNIKYLGKDSFHITRRDIGLGKIILFSRLANEANGALAGLTSTLFTRDAFERLEKS